MRLIPDDFDPEVVAGIDARLARVRQEHQVTVPWAIESGSRAWGFASPDSDYDCRFLFVRPVAGYLDPWPPRDVIETPLTGLLDANGWDLRKAVRLAVGGNATVGEWLRSPYVYAGEPTFRDELLALVEAVADGAAVRRHYLHVGRDQWAHSGAAEGRPVVLKRVLYAVRPAATLHWLDAHPERSTPPMRLGELLAAVPPPEDVAAGIARLLAAKAATRELGRDVVDPPVAAWVETAFDRGDGPPPARDRVTEARAAAARGFRDLLARWAPPD